MNMNQLEMKQSFIDWSFIWYEMNNEQLININFIWINQNFNFYILLFFIHVEYSVPFIL